MVVAVQKQREVVRLLITRSLLDQTLMKEGLRSSRSTRKRNSAVVVRFLAALDAGGSLGDRNAVPGRMKWTCVSIAKKL